MSILLTLLQAPASLQGAPPQPPPFPLLDPRLGLDAAQRKTIEGILAQHRDSLRARHEALEARRKALHEVMGNPAKSASELETLLAQETEAHRAQALEAHGVLQEAAKVLSPEQREAASRLKPAFPPMGSQGPRGSRPEGAPEGRPEPRH